MAEPACAALGWRTASTALSDFSLTRLAGGIGATCGIALAGPAGTRLVRHTCSASLSDFSLARLPGIGSTLPRISLVEPLLRLAHGRASGRISSCALISVGDVAVVVRHPAAVSRIVNPVISVSNVYSIEVIITDEVVIDYDIAAAPSAAPSPASPTAA